VSKVVKNRRPLSARIGGLLFVLPSIITVVIFVYGLIIWSVNVSLTNQNSGSKKAIEYVGLKNYTDLISDERFTHSLMNLVKFTVVFILGALITGFIMALLLEKGIKDVVRISDGRMSGTGFGTVVLHISPEATLGGNFSVLETGDLITLDLNARTLNVDLSSEELQRRKDNWKPSPAHTDRGYTSLYVSSVEQAHLGADLAFLKGGSGSEVKRDSH